MLDRASTFADPRILALLAERYIPVALDVWYEERRQDPVGEFYRTVVYQREGMHEGRTTQGFYLFGPDGTLGRGWNNRDPEKCARYLAEFARDYVAADAKQLGANTDDRFARAIPEGARVARVTMKILEADYTDDPGQWQRIFRDANGRDHLWILADEVAALEAGAFPDRLLRRLARFHWVDGTRGEPPMWRAQEVRELTLEPIAEEGVERAPWHGAFRIHTEDGERGFEGEWLADVVLDKGSLHTLDIIARGTFRGHGRWTGNDAPHGDFTLAVACTLDDSNIPPQASRDLREYLQAR